LNQVEGIQTFPLYSASRGDETVIKPLKNSTVYVLQMDKVSETDAGSFHGAIREEAGGAERFSFDVKNPGPGRPVSIKIPVSALHEGRYVLTLDGGGVSTYPFTVRFE
jgi:hypothetical protein